MSAFTPKTYDELDSMVDTDPIALRDYAWAATREVERLTQHAHDCAELDRANEDLGRALVDAKAQLNQCCDDLDKLGEAVRSVSAGHRYAADASAITEELNRLRAEVHMLRTTKTRLDSELERARVTISELTDIQQSQRQEIARLDGDNADLAGRLQTAQEQLAAHELETAP